MDFIRLLDTEAKTSIEMFIFEMKERKYFSSRSINAVQV